MRYLKWTAISLLLVSGLTIASHAQSFNKKISEVIEAGDVVRTNFAGTAKINLYQGNGRFGSSYGSLGLHNNPVNGRNSNQYGLTQYMHINHWVRARFNADYLIPTVQMYWSEEPSVVTNYIQHQYFYKGLLKTGFETANGKTVVETWFDQVDRDLLGVIIDVEGKAADVIIDPMENLNVHYGQPIMQSAQVIKHQGYFEIQLKCINRTASVFLSTNDKVTLDDNRLVVRLHPGRNWLQLSYSRPASASATVSKNRTVKWWREKWAGTSTLMLPDKDAQQLWVRSMALILSTANDDKRGFPPPMSFTGNLWPFSFPQDLSFIHSALLSTGNIQIAKAWIEQFAAGMEGMKDYTKRMFKVDGIFCPWVFPYGSFKDYHMPGPPNIFNYEIHNSGYLCRMAYETAQFVNDERWTRTYALELIRQTAIFYRNIVKKGQDGYWHLYIEPSMGQDEMGGVNKKDYLCALFSAKYCFQKAVELNLDFGGVYRRILLEGLAFPSLKSGKGVYFTNKSGTDEDLGRQKHPVQLNELAYLPVDLQVSEPSLIAYKKRYELTADADRPHFYGWTLGEFLLAGSRVGDVDGWKKDWNNIVKSNYTDKERIQLYETSSAYNASFYSTTNGLIVQSLIGNLVGDWFNKLEISKCNPWSGDVYLKRVYSILGVCVTGTINRTDAYLSLNAWKDSELELCGKKFILKKGKTIKVTILKNQLVTYK